MLEKILNLFKIPTPPTIPIPSFVLLNAQKRGGLSAIRLANKVIGRESEILGTETPHQEMLRVICEELIREIQENGVVEIGVQPSGQVTCVGVTASGIPLTAQGTMVTVQKGIGILK